MSDIAPSGPIPMLKIEPGGGVVSIGDMHNNLCVTGHIPSVVIGMNGSPRNSGVMMPTIINDESISAPGSPLGSGMLLFDKIIVL